MLLTCIKRLLVLKTNMWSFCEWPFYTGFTVTTCTHVGHNEDWSDKVNGRGVLTLGAHATLLVTSWGGSCVITPINSFDRHVNSSSFTLADESQPLQINEP